MNVIEAIKDRKSTRAFLDKPVPKDIISAILKTARWSPSGTNTQPWQVSVVTGETQKSISEAYIQAFQNGKAENHDYAYYPNKIEPYNGRRFECGIALYKALDIKRDDQARRMEQWMNNYRFFDAPVGLFFFIEDVLHKGSWVDMGMFIQSVMLAARGYGLETCAQFSMAAYPEIVREKLKIEDRYLLVSGMAIGYEDTSNPVNQYRTAREEVDSFTRWHD